MALIFSGLTCPISLLFTVDVASTFAKHHLLRGLSLARIFRSNLISNQNVPCKYKFKMATSSGQKICECEDDFSSLIVQFFEMVPIRRMQWKVPMPLLYHLL